ncbi:MAG: hypothetical protein HY302_09925 [Opitutae bacterium]|nr:hypothetical protein [Opitutae bacterium]
MNSNLVQSAAQRQPRAVSGLAAYKYDSGWVQAVQADTELLFRHGLNAVPSQVLIVFSPNLESSWPLTWLLYFPDNLRRAPVAVDEQTVAITITAAAPLHRGWDDRLGWTNWASGSFRVFASP